MNTKRLLVLADYLDTVPRELFNMREFGEFQNAKRDCGSTACALGYATLIPSFRRAGFKAIGFRYGSTYQAEPTYKENEGFNAAETFFAIDSETCSSLFGGYNSCTTPKQVARHIRQVVKEYSLEVERDALLLRRM